MDSRQRIRAIIGRKTPDRTGFWLGNPDGATWPILHRHFATSDQEALRQKLGDDFRWIAPFDYAHPEGRPMWDISKHAFGSAGPLAACETVAEVEAWPHWPDAAYMDFAPTIAALRATGPYYRASGMWTHFYHVVMDLFGFEDYLAKMHTHPAVVEAATERVCQFFYDANERFFPLARGEVDGYFFGNDFGTQQDCICSPKLFDRFVLPWFRRFTEQGHRHGLQVILHSCGSIHRVIPRLIDAGVDCLHPLQAKARGMDAADLARQFSGKIAFLGGIDAQDLLPHGTPQQIRDEVCRVRDLLGPHVIISPSHEAVLPDVPPENVAAMAAAAVEPQPARIAAA
jgi:uroporphyrinogen decarboxylase